MGLATEVMFSAISDNYRTPRKWFERQDARFGFEIDLAATRKHRLCEEYLGPDHVESELRDALRVDWMAHSQARGIAPRGYWNCPYSLCSEFCEKAAAERRKGFLSAGLIPSRTDTGYWHRDIWDEERHRPRPGVQVEFQRGRLQFSLDVTPEMRQAVQLVYAKAIRPKSKAEKKELEKLIATSIKLPLLITRAIIEGKPEAVESAPFPSCFVIFWPEGWR